MSRTERDAIAYVDWSDMFDPSRDGSLSNPRTREYRRREHKRARAVIRTHMAHGRYDQLSAIQSFRKNYCDSLRWFTNG